ncbi:hypothetical protein KSI87_06985 [Dickeya zeae]|nr:hypothetical protein [Dickeya zeae]
MIFYVTFKIMTLQFNIKAEMKINKKMEKKTIKIIKKSRFFSKNTKNKEMKNTQ